MTDFRKWFLAIAVLSLLSGILYFSDRPNWALANNSMIIPAPPVPEAPAYARTIPVPPKLPRTLKEFLEGSDGPICILRIDTSIMLNPAESQKETPPPDYAVSKPSSVKQEETLLVVPIV